MEDYLLILSVLTPCGEFTVSFIEDYEEDTADTVFDGSQLAIGHFNMAMRLGITGDDGHQLDAQSIDAQSLLQYVNGQYGMTVSILTLHQG